MLAGVGSINEEIITKLDITLKGDSVLTSDLIRILKPLKKNFELARELKSRVDNYTTYLYQYNTDITGKIRSSMPTGALLNRSFRYSDESIEMTDKQKRARKEQHDKVMRNALCGKHEC